MNEHHFICQLCRDKKNIIFYKELDQLLDHYRILHYVCPYEECIADMFVVFDSEEKLNSHLITKHKCVDAQGKLSSFMFSSDNKSKSKNYQTKTYNIKDEFNFSQYVNELRDRVNDHIKNMQNKKVYVKSYEEEISYIGGRHNMRFNNNYDNSYYNYNNDNNQITNYGNANTNYYGKRGKGQKYDDSSIQNQRGNTRRTGDTQDYLDYNNQYGHENQNYHQDNYNQDPYQQNQNYQGQGARKKNKFYKPNNQFEDKQEVKYPKEQINVQQNINKIPAKIDYSFIFNLFFKIIKEYIVQKINLNNPKEEEFIIPKETTYQMIIIIDKLENDKLIELGSLSNFGLDLDIFKELKALIKDASFDTNTTYKVLDKLEIKKLLILYKYIGIACKKIDGLFYKLGKYILIKIIRL
jgi:hypothetical protein